MTMEELICKSCGKKINVKARYHTGFNNTGFLYCNKDSTVITFSSYDPIYQQLAGDVHPWAIVERNDRDKMELIEKSLIDCPCGGKFYFDNPLRCPNCGEEISEPMAKNIYFFVIGREIDGEKRSVWKNR